MYSKWKKIIPVGIVFLFVDFILSYYLIIIKPNNDSTINTDSSNSQTEQDISASPNQIKQNNTVKIGKASFNYNDFTQDNNNVKSKKSIFFYKITLPDNLDDISFPNNQPDLYQKIISLYDKFKNQELTDNLFLNQINLILSESEIKISSQKNTINLPEALELTDKEILSELKYMVQNEVSQIYFSKTGNYYYFVKVISNTKI